MNKRLGKPVKNNCSTVYPEFMRAYPDNSIHEPHFKDVHTATWIEVRKNMDTWLLAYSLLKERQDQGEEQ